jgi:sensor histidine kinase YesM
MALSSSNPASATAVPPGEIRLVAVDRRWVKWAMIFGATTLFILINCTTVYIGHLYRLFPNTNPVPWKWLLLEQMAIWYPIALLAPAIIWCGRRFRLERQTWLWILPVHLGLTLAYDAAHTLISLPLFRLLETGSVVMPMATFLQFAVQRIVARIPLSLLTYWMILGVGYAFEYYRRYREQQFQASRLELRASQLEARLVEAQLQALRMQLQPHFLFNTLHAVSALMEDDIKAARRMIARLSELLRLTLEQSAQQEVSLEQELEALARYLEIEQIRFQDRLRVEMKIDPETLGARVPHLILQPLVENAIRHGIAPLSTAGWIKIGASRQNGMLELEVRDDGPGLPAGEAVFKEGIGLGNTRARLEQLYGREHRFEMSNAEGGGLLIRLAIPFQKEEFTSLSEQ